MQLRGLGGKSFQISVEVVVRPVRPVRPLHWLAVCWDVSAPGYRRYSLLRCLSTRVPTLQSVEMSQHPGTNLPTGNNWQLQFEYLSAICMDSGHLLEMIMEAFKFKNWLILGNIPNLRRCWHQPLSLAIVIFFYSSHLINQDVASSVVQPSDKHF